MKRIVPKLPDSYYRLDNHSGIIAWLGDAAVIVISIAIAVRWSAFYPVAVLLIGARQRAFATLLHEAAHRTLAKSRRLNLVLGLASAYLVFQTFDAYKASHITGHHGKFGTPDDPDLAFHREIGLYGPVTPSRLWHGLLRYMRYLIVNRLLPSRASRIELVRMAALWALIAACVGPCNVVLFWVVPMVVAFGPIGFLIEIAEHWPLMPASDPLYRTRNRGSSRFEHFLFSLHNEDKHLIHHLYPRLPFGAMRAANAFLEATWPEYRAWNAANGGILLSGNGAPSILALLVSAMRAGRQP